MSAYALMAACNGQNGHPTTPDTDTTDATIAVSDADTVSTITPSLTLSNKSTQLWQTTNTQQSIAG